MSNYGKHLEIYKKIQSSTEGEWWETKERPKEMEDRRAYQEENVENYLLSQSFPSLFSLEGRVLKLKGIVQRILRGVNTRLKKFVLVNWRPASFSF